ncbi:MAG: hypothetical protein R3C44_21345 [Chloroflexota bacterium]
MSDSLEILAIGMAIAFVMTPILFFIGVMRLISMKEKPLCAGCNRGNTTEKRAMSDSFEILAIGLALALVFSLPFGFVAFLR